MVSCLLPLPSACVVCVVLGWCSVACYLRGVSQSLLLGRVPMFIGFRHDRSRAEAKGAITMSCLPFVTPDKKGYGEQDLALERRFT